MSRNPDRLRPVAERDAEQVKEQVMKKLIYWVHTSIDGFIVGPNDEFDWAQMAPELSDYGFELHDRVDTFLYGRLVWEMMSGYWPNAEEFDDDEHTRRFAPIWRATDKVVFSRTLASAGYGARVMGKDLAADIAELKAQPGKDLLLNGGSNLASALTGLGLIDEYQIVVHPAVLGGGKPLFFQPKGILEFKLIGSRTFDERTVLLRYERAS
jgi:dihydrofolate reductase